jgi:peptidylprolyl isomerase
MRTHPISHLLGASAVFAILVAGCGSSAAKGNSAIQQAPSAPEAAVATPAAITTPKSGPLSKEPTIAKPKGPAPAKLETIDLVKGTGAVVKLGDTITVNYVGATYDNGKVFQASWTTGAPFETQLVNGGLIAGWLDGLPGMRVGGRRELIIPAALAYGAHGQAAAGIGPNQPLIFDVDMLGATAAP